jgi:hypothetical protein
LGVDVWGGERATWPKPRKGWRNGDGDWGCQLSCGRGRPEDGDRRTVCCMEKNWVNSGRSAQRVLPPARWTPRAQPFHRTAHGNDAPAAAANRHGSAPSSTSVQLVIPIPILCRCRRRPYSLSAPPTSPLASTLSADAPCGSSESALAVAHGRQRLRRRGPSLFCGHPTCADPSSSSPSPSIIVGRTKSVSAGSSDEACSQAPPSLDQVGFIWHLLLIPVSKTSTVSVSILMALVAINCKIACSLDTLGPWIDMDL